MRETVKLLHREMPDFLLLDSWPLHGPDLNPVDYQIQVTMQERGYNTAVHSIDET